MELTSVVRQDSRQVERVLLGLRYSTLRTFCPSAGRRRSISRRLAMRRASATEASGPNLTFRFTEGFRVGLGCASLGNARANGYPIERRRPLRACSGGGQPQQPAEARLASENRSSDCRWSGHCRDHGLASAVALRFTLRGFWCPGLLGNVFNGCGGATRDLAA